MRLLGGIGFKFFCVSTCAVQYMANVVGNSMALSIEVGLCLKTPKCDALDRLLRIIGK